MKIGSHNTMTYLKPKKWYMYPFIPFAKCQSKDVEEQYDAGARWFDIRIAFDKKGDPEFKHGIMSYEGDVLKVFEYLNTKDDVIVRVLSEDGHPFFSGYCLYLQNRFPNMRFSGGQNKKDWKQLHTFKNEEYYSAEDYFASSPNNPKWWGLFPWIYSFFKNRKIEERNVDYLIIDYVK